MDATILFSELKSLKGVISWDLITVQEIISEIAVISKNPTSDTVLPLVLSVLDKAKAVALEKVPQGKSSDEVAQKFDELKILAKHLVPVVVSVQSVEAVKAFGCFSWLCASREAVSSVSKTIDQTAQQVEKVDDIVASVAASVAPVEVALTGDSKVSEKVSEIVQEVSAVAQNVEAVAQQDKTL